MRLHDSSVPDTPQYFIRSSPEEAERGPFSAENLADLADCDQVLPDTLARSNSAPEWRPIRDWPNLVAEVFPQKKSFHFKSYERKEDPDAGLPPVDTRHLLRCESGSAESPTAASKGRPVSPMSLKKQENPGSTSGFDPKAILAESRDISRARALPADKANYKKRFEAGRAFFIFRWGLAFVLFGTGFWIWSGINPNFVDIVFGLIIGMVPTIGGILLIVSDVINWGMDAVANQDNVVPLDYSRAEQYFSAGEWRKAANEYLRLLENYPHETRPYIAGIAAAVAAEDQKKVAAFHAFAEKHLGDHDRNLIAEALRRRGLPPLPEKPR